MVNYEPTVQVVTKSSLKQSLEVLKSSGGFYPSESVTLAETKIGKNMKTMSQAEAFKAAFSAKTFQFGNGSAPKVVGKYGSILAAPLKWADGKTESVLDRVARGAFAKQAQGSSINTLIPDWQQLWEAMRLDITIRKTAQPTLRQFVYNMMNRPDADKTNDVIDYLPWLVKFEEVNGNGQPVPQGTRYGALKDTFDVKIYGAGFTWSLLAALFDKSLDMTQLNDAVAVGESALKDHLAFAPILAYNYSTAGTAKHTAADSSGSDKYEKLYFTLENAIEDLAKRFHPVITTQKIPANELIYIGSENSARHVAKVIGGFQSVVDNRPFPQLSEIRQIIGYDGESTHGYDGVGDTYGYLIRRNEFMNIITKRGLTVEIDMQPDVKTLAQEERAWWFAEGLYYGGDYGVGSFVQKITLPSW